MRQGAVIRVLVCSECGNRYYGSRRGGTPDRTRSEPTRRIFYLLFLLHRTQPRVPGSRACLELPYRLYVEVRHAAHHAHSLASLPTPTLSPLLVSSSRLLLLIETQLPLELISFVSSWERSHCCTSWVTHTEVLTSGIIEW